MKKQGLAGLIILTIVTFGIYGIVWYARTRGEMVRKGADIPTTWLIIIPFVSIYWLYKYSAGVEKITNGKQNATVVFLLMWFLSIVGMAIVQNEFNQVVDAPVSDQPTPPISPSPTDVNPPQPTAPAAPAV